jgi:pilus assembly protein CpaB
MSTSLKIGLVLLLAMVLAVAARLVYNARIAPPPEPQVRVWATATALPAGLLLRDTDVAWQSYPQTDVPPGAITEGSKEAQLNGAVVRRNLPAGRVLTTNDVILPQAPGFLSAALQPDMRAISVPVNDVSGNAGLIRPGDYVDLILTQDLRSMGLGLDGVGPQGGVVSETVVEHARVIAVGSTFAAVDERVDSEAASSARTVTLEVSPRAAEAVAVAARLGTLSLALRSFVHANRSPAGTQPEGAQVTAWDDRSREPVWAGDVSRAMSALPRAQPAPVAPAAPRYEAPAVSARPAVTILRGSTANPMVAQP